MERIGFLGVGHLATAMIAGLMRSGLPPDRIVLSPRGSSAAVAARFGLECAPDNAALVAGCDAVVLAVRPQHAADAVAGLPWRADHVLVSVCAGVPLAALAAAAPARLVRAMPLTAAAYGASPTALYPDDAQARRLLDHLGPILALDAETQFEVASVSGAIYGWAQILIGQAAAWSAAHGLPEAMARRLVAATFVAAGRNVAESAEPIPDLLRALITPGGITERGRDVLAAGGVPAAWDKACDAVFDKLTG